MDEAKIIQGDCLSVLPTLPKNSVQCVVTSPPYFNLRSYSTVQWIGGDPNCDHVANPNATKVFGNPEFNENRPSREATKTPGYYMKTCPKCGAGMADEQIGNEETLDKYIANLLVIFGEVRRVLSDTGILLLNLGDSYASQGGGQVVNSINSNRKGGSDTQNSGNSRSTPIGFKPKDLMFVPFRVAMALQEDGWWVRSIIPWIKINPIPGSQGDRPTVSTEYVFLLSKSQRYFFDMEAVKRPTADSSIARAKRAVGENKYYEGAPGQKAQALSQPREYGEGEIGTVRSLRESDFFFDSLQSILDGEQGLLYDEDPLAFVLSTGGYKGAHYATMPQRLAEICVLAGTSEVGECPHCGAPWKRIIERNLQSQTMHNGDWENDAQDMTIVGSRGRLRVGLDRKTLEEKCPGYITLGWKQTCSCPEHEPVPQTVLDPFSGVGTTGLVALKNRRRYVGIELSQDYIDQTWKRFEGIQQRMF